MLADLGSTGASEVVATMAPGTCVVKAFNSIVTVRFNEGPIKNGGRRVIFVSGDHREPAAFVESVTESFGFAAVYLGGLAAGERTRLEIRGRGRSRRLVDHLDCFAQG